MFKYLFSTVRFAVALVSKVDLVAHDGTFEGLLESRNACASCLEVLEKDFGCLRNLESLPRIRLALLSLLPDRTSFPTKPEDFNDPSPNSCSIFLRWSKIQGAFRTVGLVHWWSWCHSLCLLGTPSHLSSNGHSGSKG